MVDNIENIANALLALLTAATASAGSSPFAWAQPPSRAAKIWGNVDPASQPCMFVIGVGGTIGQTAGYGTSKGCHHFNILVYMRADADTLGTIPETQLNAAWVSIINAMMTDPATGNTFLLPGKPQNLGLAYVANAWIEGDWFMDTGILDQQMALVIPIKVTVGIVAGNK
jgi:hypothetical protein